MDGQALTTAIAAILGALVGGVATALTTHWTVRFRQRRETVGTAKLVAAELADHRQRLEAQIKAGPVATSLLLRRWPRETSAWRNHGHALARELDSETLVIVADAYFQGSIAETLAADAAQRRDALAAVHQALTLLRGFISSEEQRSQRLSGGLQWGRRDRKAARTPDDAT